MKKFVVLLREMDEIKIEADFVSSFDGRIVFYVNETDERSEMIADFKEDDVVGFFQPEHVKR